MNNNNKDNKDNKNNDSFIEGDRIIVRDDAIYIRRDIRNCLGTILKWTTTGGYIVKMDQKAENGGDEFLLFGSEIKKV